MAPLRKPSNGRSPLVNPNRQITCFFSKVNSSSPSFASELSKGETLKSNPNPKSPSHSPATPSPLGSKSRKPLLVISPSTPSIGAASYGEEVVGKRIRVYWPSDKAWYEGCVKSFFVDSGRHFVLYDDFEEAVLDLRKEKVEWVEETVKKFKRLRRGSLAFKKTAIQDEEMENTDKSKEDLDFEDQGDDDNAESKEKEKQVEKNMSRKRKACKIKSRYQETEQEL